MDEFECEDLVEPPVMVVGPDEAEAEVDLDLNDNGAKVDKERYCFLGLARLSPSSGAE